MLRQQKFLNNVLERLNDEKGQKEVVAEIECVRKCLTMPESMTLYMATNVDKLTVQVPNVYSSWNNHFSELKATSKTKYILLLILKYTPVSTYKLQICILITQARSYY